MLKIYRSTHHATHIHTSAYTYTTQGFLREPQSKTIPLGAVMVESIKAMADAAAFAPADLVLVVSESVMGAASVDQAAEAVSMAHEPRTI